MVATAQNGEEALRLVEEMNPDLLILDLQMPKVNGWEVLCQLQDSNASVRVLVLSAHAAEHYQQRVVQRGATAYVPKGNMQLLTDTLHYLLDD